MVYSKNNPVDYNGNIVPQMSQKNADFILKIKDINHEHIWESDKNIWYKKITVG